MLAICSDLDETPDRRVYAEIMRFLNTTEDGCMGAGVGLEVGNSIYFDMPPGQFSYWNTDDAGRAMLRELMRSGHVDCLHSFGELAATRGHAERALEELSRHDCRVEVWSDHATAPSNFGADIMRGVGDVEGSPAYHADLTCGFGVKYVWRGRVTSVIGQDVPIRWGGIWSPAQPATAAKTVLKEYAKNLLGRFGHDKYAMHAPNEVLRPATLRSGQAVWEFLRCNPHGCGVSSGDTAHGLAEVLRPDVLDRLVRREGIMVLYTHLGKIRRRDEPLPAHTRAALRRLARYERAGQILVTTTRRLLGYCSALRGLRLSAGVGDGTATVVEVRSNEDWADLAGLTVYVPDSATARLSVNGSEVGLTPWRHGPDHTGRPSISLPWKRLEFPPLRE